MNGKDVREIIKTAVSLFLICAVAAGILAAVNGITAPTIKENSEKTAEAARLKVLPEAVSFNTEEQKTADGTVYYTGFDADGEIAGYVFTTSANGYGGTVEIMTGLDKDGKVTGIEILTINETPGLGMNAKKDSFRDRFKGKSAENGKLAVKKDGGDIDALSSATITSRAVTNAVNLAFDYYIEITAEGGTAK